MSRHDLIGIGGSAGALPALLSLLQAFDGGNDVTLFVVIHRTDRSNRLCEIIQRATALETCQPDDGDPIRPGHLYLAPTDRHLLVSDGHVHLRRGPRENNFRPSIDPLFRSIAVAGSGRAIGIVLSGYLDDGAAGLRAVMQCGGLGVVQDPLDAISPDMPRAAISAVGEPRLIASAPEIGKALPSLIAEPAGPRVEAPSSMRLELMIAGLEEANMESEESLGELSPYNCPDCNGVLWQIEDGPMLRFRCHTGHAYSGNALLEAQAGTIEQSLYETLRGQRERARLLRQMAERDPMGGERWTDRAADYDRAASLIEGLILQGGQARPQG
ncbi:chemotaxis protein CheB [Stakelama sp. CBK3Z-3]|uniref:Chemotaxis protein CheB n=1 Tax=Stakelama flava TaxID=2860338 RepID=A0ABS6XLL8_9SPHN|nr:chemotaxis protein CheB [Stakelama flava]MBW4330814.1 chemotaxis protein CheB [Stakelama flava]